MDPNDKRVTNMKAGCVNNRVRIVFWDDKIELFIAVTPDFLAKNGVPINPQTGEKLTYNSTHLAH